MLDYYDINSASILEIRKLPSYIDLQKNLFNESWDIGLI